MQRLQGCTHMPGAMQKLLAMLHTLLLHVCPYLNSFLFIFLFPGEFSRQINDFKIKLQKAEQDNARLEGLVSRLKWLK